MSQRFDLPGVIVHQDGFDPHDDRPWTPFPRESPTSGAAITNSSTACRVGRRTRAHA